MTTNSQALTHAIASLPPLHTIDPRLSLHIVTEAPSLPALTSLRHSATLHGVPPSFTPRLAKYKARALEFFRLTICPSPSDWLLHLDEETHLTAHTLHACIAAIERNPDMHIAQGMILYNAKGYWGNWLTAAADVVRVLDDLGRYQAQWNWLGTPVFGMHGSFVLVNGEVEGDVGWETGCLTEDYWFAVQVSSYLRTLSTYVGRMVCTGR